MRLPRLCALLALGTALAACGDPDNDLSGSISESFPLEFDSVRIRKQNVTLLIEYLKSGGANPEKVCKVIVDTENLPLKNDSNITRELFQQRVKIQREGPTGSDFPPLSNGQIKFKVFEFRAGGRIDGEFNAVFNNGRTITGYFDGKVEEVSVQ